MRLSEILSVERIFVDPTGARTRDKSAVLGCLADLLAQTLGVTAEEVRGPLWEREQLQSTGIGDGVAIPHTALDAATTQTAALLLCPQGVPFDAIDGAPVRIVFGVVGPKRAASEHLKILAKVSRLLRSPETRRRLLESPSAEHAYALIEEHESSSLGT
ncbi:MAG TPA: PTS sugar transporter subunit IIA [Polyangiaceae bacterium]|nr:PTS sugar transporter subunit IIA [Polyangiaceae bacterium]